MKRTILIFVALFSIGYASMMSCVVETRPEDRISTTINITFIDGTTEEMTVNVNKDYPDIYLNDNGCITSYGVRGSYACQVRSFKVISR